MTDVLKEDTLSANDEAVVVKCDGVCVVLALLRTSMASQVPASFGKEDFSEGYEQVEKHRESGKCQGDQGPKGVAWRALSRTPRPYSIVKRVE